MAAHYFYCYMRSYIVFSVVIVGGCLVAGCWLRHTCITFLLIELIEGSVKRNVHFIAPSSLSPYLLLAHESEKRSSFQCALT